MKVLLVYPKYPDTFWSYKHILKYISKKAVFPPLGLLTVASMLPKSWDLRLVDLNVKKLKDADLEWADMVFVSAMIVQKDSAAKIIERASAMGKTVVCGGPYFTTQYEKHPDVDHFVLNEGEVTIPMFLADLKKGKANRVYSSEKRPDIQKTPLPMWELIDTKKYVSLAVQYSRGCPYNCEFCDIVVMNGRRPRTKSPAQMMREFKALHRTGYKGAVFIVDDNFIGNKKEVKKLLPRLIKWQKANKYPFTFLTEASTDLAGDQELMDMMREANFTKVFLGIETPNVDSLKECGKYQNVSRDLGEAVRTINHNGLQVMGGFIVGFDNDTESIFDAQIRFIQENGIPTAMVGILNALPQTALWKRLKKEGRLVSDVTSGENTDVDINFIPKMDREVLMEGYKRVIRTIYSSKAYYQRLNIFLKDYEPSVKGRLKKADIIAFFNSVIRIGVLSSARFRYWKLLIKTSITKRKAFPVAVEYAILGEHYRRISKRIARTQA